MILRDYQVRSAERIIEEWKEHLSTLLVLPTGCGKTQVFSDIIRRSLPKRSLVLVHREELAFQARKRIEALGIACEIEMAEMKASTTLWNRTPCVIASVQTLYRRLHHFKPSDFGVVICDEAHHSVAATWRSIIDHFKQNPEVKILGVTATPDRSDEEALGQIFETVAFDYEILDAIHDGWLVPVEQQMVNIAGLDFSSVRTTAGDLNGADLAAVMEAEQNIQGIVGSSIEIIGDRSSLLFASSVRHAEMACEIFNRHRPKMAAFICGTTDKEERRGILARFLDGTTQVLCNVGIATEGFDAPEASVVLNGRPTKSRALYAQIAGRVLRPLPGLVDGLPTELERRGAIAASKKPAALLVDFVGNSGKHKLMSSADILGGNVSDEAVELAIARAKESGVPMRMNELLDESEANLKAEKEKRRLADEARRARLVAKVTYSTQAVNPFDILDITPVRERGWDAGKKLSEKQRNILLKQGIDGDAMPYGQAKVILNEMFRRWRGELCSYGQAKVLKRYGYATKNMTKVEASAKFDELKRNNWRKPVTPSQFSDVIAPNKTQLGGFEGSEAPELGGWR